MAVLRGVLQGRNDVDAAFIGLVPLRFPFEEVLIESELLLFGELGDFVRTERHFKRGTVRIIRIMALPLLQRLFEIFLGEERQEGFANLHIEEPSL